MKTSTSQLIQIQEIVFEYFKDTDTATVISLTNAFAFNNVQSNDNETGKIIQKFLIDNGLETAYVNYVSDVIRNEQKFFIKSESSEMQTIEQVKLAFLVLSFNRLRNEYKAPIKLKEADKIKILGTGDIKAGVHIISNVVCGDEYTLCGIMTEGEFVGTTEKTTETCDCKNCIAIVKQCKGIKL